MSNLTPKEMRTARKARLAAAKRREASNYDDELDAVLAEIDEELSVDADLDELEAEIEAEIEELEAGSMGMPMMGEEHEEGMEEEEAGMGYMEDSGYMKGKGYSGLGHGVAAGYYPSTTKPTGLDPETSRNTGGLYHYYGPPPDAGFSYGSDMSELLAAIVEAAEKGRVERAKDWAKGKAKAAPGAAARAVGRGAKGLASKLNQKRKDVGQFAKKVRKNPVSTGLEHVTKQVKKIEDAPGNIAKGVGKVIKTVSGPGRRMWGKGLRAVWNKVSAPLKKKLEGVHARLRKLKGKGGEAVGKQRAKLSATAKKIKGQISSKFGKIKAKMKGKMKKGSALDVYPEIDGLDIIASLFEDLYEATPEMTDAELRTASVNIELPRSCVQLIAEVDALTDDLMIIAEWIADASEIRAAVELISTHNDVATVIVSSEDLANLTETDVAMQLFGGASENPHWNLTVRGKPVAAIYLADQPNTPEVRAMFVDDAYANAIAEGITRKPGLEDVLTSVNAKRYASVVKESALADEIGGEVRTSLEAEYQMKTAESDQNFLRCMSIALAGFQKNFFPGRNSLKTALYEEMARAGVLDPGKAIEAAFTEGGVEFFEAAVSKSRELMDMPPEAVVHIANAIGESQIQLPAHVEEHIEAAVDGYSATSMRERMASNNVPFSTYGEPNAQDVDFRERVRAALGKKPRGR